MTPIRRPKRRRYSALAVLLLFGCLDPFAPPPGSFIAEALVVDGLLNSATNTATVKLSHPWPLDVDQPAPVVKGATITISGPSGDFTLIEERPGEYKKTGVPVINGEKYTLHVVAEGREFYSDPVEAMSTPPIDSLTFGVSNDTKSLEVRINTRDPSGQATYFSWDYVETYEYTSVFFSGYDLKNGAAVIRKPDELIYRCWRTIPSSSIGIVTTRELSASVVSQVPIITIPGGSIKTSWIYSVLVSQRVIGGDEYNYLRQLKAATENLGGLFDPQPGIVVGNMHEKDQPGTHVHGYFSVSEIEQKRVFIEYEELPENLKIPQDHGGCEIDVTCDIRGTFGFACYRLEDLNYASKVLYVAFTDPMGNPTSYAFTRSECADCRLLGGVTQRPAFWPPPH